MTKLLVCFFIVLLALICCHADELECTGPNEIADCRSTCELECATLDEEEECNIRYIQCEYKCWCKENYARNDRGICIPIFRCPRRKPCPPRL